MKNRHALLLVVFLLGSRNLSLAAARGEDVRLLRSWSEATLGWYLTWEESFEADRKKFREQGGVVEVYCHLINGSECEGRRYVLLVDNLHAYFAIDLDVSGCVVADFVRSPSIRSELRQIRADFERIDAFSIERLDQAVRPSEGPVEESRKESFDRFLREVSLVLSGARYSVLMPVDRRPEWRHNLEQACVPRVSMYDASSDILVQGRVNAEAAALDVTTSAGTRMPWLVEALLRDGLLGRETGGKGAPPQSVPPTLLNARVERAPRGLDRPRQPHR